MNELEPVKAIVPAPVNKVRSFLDARRSPATRRVYGSVLRDFTARLGLQTGDALLHVTPEQVIAYRDALMADGQADTTVARKLSTIRSLYAYAVRRGWLAENPADALIVQSPRVSQESTTVGLTRAEARQVLDAIPRDTIQGKRDYAMMTLLLYHGLRRAELLSLTPMSFGTERRFITLTIRGKGGKVRKHPVKPATLEAIEQYLQATGREMTGDAALFRPVKNNTTGILAKALTSEGVRLIVRRRCLSAGITKRITPHSLRHTSITNALDNGASIRRVADFAGHTDVNMTARYDRGRGNLDDNAAHKIEF